MTTIEIAAALEAWAAETTGANAYDHPPEQLDKALPLVACEIQRAGRVGDDRQLPERAYQQHDLRVWRADLILLVAPDPAWTASQALYQMVDDLAAALAADRTLGGRVEVASPMWEASFDPPEVEYPDGTVARQATFSIVVGESVEV